MSGRTKKVFLYFGTTIALLMLFLWAYPPSLIYVALAHNYHLLSGREVKEKIFPMGYITIHEMDVRGKRISFMTNVDLMSDGTFRQCSIARDDGGQYRSGGPHAHGEFQLKRNQICLKTGGKSSDPIFGNPVEVPVRIMCFRYWEDSDGQLYEQLSRYPAIEVWSEKMHPFLDLLSEPQPFWSLFQNFFRVLPIEPRDNSSAICR